MKRIIVASLTIAGVLSTIGSSFAFSWQQVSPRAKEICSTNVPFQVVQETTSNRQAADFARAQFCKSVRSGR